jgi:acetolactate synthase-1/2/3 large subunit
MKVADYIINYLAQIGVTDVFLVYGAANGDLVDAFTRNEDINYVCVMHEQAGGFAAEGYAKIKGDIGVALATSGPGGQNFVTPIANCFYDSVPCLFITGQVNSRFMRPNTSIRQIGFQETDIVSIVKPITKFAYQLKSPNECVPFRAIKRKSVKTSEFSPRLISGQAIRARI